MEIFIITMEILGTIAFAISGAMEAIKHKMDLLGVIILGITTSVGGGIVRDIVIGNTPPQAFKNPTYLLIAFIVSLIVFLFLFVCKKRKRYWNLKKWYELLLLLFDAIGLGVFTTVGISIAILKVGIDNLFLCTFVGVITGVGGGVLRDIFVNKKPYIFTKHIYASASIIGATVCTLLWNIVNDDVAMIIGTLVIIIIRLLAAYYKWSLPKIE